MGTIQTLLVTFLQSGAQAVINAADFDPAVHREGAASTPKKKAAKKWRAK